MADNTSTSKSQLLSEIDRSWIALNSYLASLSEDQMTALRDERGWTIKDHLAHLSVWERSVVFFFQGKPRYQALGIDQALFTSDDFDEQNEVARKQSESMPLGEVIAQLKKVHGELMDFVNPLTEADLNRPFRSYPPDTPTEDQRSVRNLIQGDSSEHFSEHLAWIEAIVKAAD